MSSVRKKRDVEKFLLRDFLARSLDATVIRVLARKDPRPDCYAVVVEDGTRSVIEAEITEYHCDTPNNGAGGSPGERLERQWRTVQDYLLPRLNRRPLKFDVNVSLLHPTKPIRDTRRFATELLQFVRSARLTSDHRSDLIEQFPPGYPLLSRHISELRLRRSPFPNPLVVCDDASAAFIGLIPERVGQIIRGKSAKNYTWAKNALRVLLICASGNSIVGRAGRPMPDEFWQHPQIRDALALRAFDRVYFWERISGWFKQLCELPTCC